MKVYFVPKPDITAYELAIIYANIGLGFLPNSQATYALVRGLDMYADWDTFDPRVRRHFTVDPPELPLEMITSAT